MCGRHEEVPLYTLISSCVRVDAHVLYQTDVSAFNVKKHSVANVMLILLNCRDTVPRGLRSMDSGYCPFSRQRSCGKVVLSVLSVCQPFYSQEMGSPLVRVVPTLYKSPVPH